MNIREEIEKRKLIAVLTLHDADTAADVARALWDGGVTAVELTLRTPGALACLRRVKSACPEMLLGAGTVLTPEQVAQARDAGADFGVSPGTNRRVLEAAHKAGMFFAPGIMTPTDIESALEAGCTLLKYFPAATAGGLEHLRAMSTPYLHLGVKFIPLGGVNPENLRMMVSDKLIAAVGGSWLATAEQVENRKFGEIRAQAEAAKKILSDI